MILYKLLILFILSIIIYTAKSDDIENAKSYSAKFEIRTNLVDSKEKELLKNLCHSKSAFFNDTKILVIKNGKYQYVKTLNCDTNFNIRQFVWISQNDIDDIIIERSQIQNELLVAKPANETLSEAGLCAFDIHSEICDAKAENQPPTSSSHYKLLAQLLPVKIKISNFNYKPWKNVTNSGYPMPMSGKIALTNYQETVQKVYESNIYSYFEVVSLNLNEIVPEEMGADLDTPKAIYYNNDWVEIENNGKAHVPRNNDITFVRILPALSAVNATLYGQWSTAVLEYSATIQYDYDGYYKANYTIEDSKMTVKSIADVEIKFNDPISLSNNIFAIQKSISPVTVKTNSKEQINPEAEKIFQIHSPNDTSDANKKDQNINVIQVANFKYTKQENSTSVSHVYPEFNSWFIAGCMILGAVSFLVFGNMIKILYKEKQLKQQRYRTGSLI